MPFWKIAKTPACYGVIALLGAALLIISPQSEKLTRSLAFHDGLVTALVEIMLWLAGASAFIIYARRAGMREDAVLRWMLAVAIFILFLLPQSKWDHMIAAGQLLALTGGSVDFH